MENGGKVPIKFRKPSHQATKQPSNQAAKQPSSQATKQPSNQPTHCFTHPLASGLDGTRKFAMEGIPGAMAIITRRTRSFHGRGSGCKMSSKKNAAVIYTMQAYASYVTEAC